MLGPFPFINKVSAARLGIIFLVSLFAPTTSAQTAKSRVIVSLRTAPEVRISIELNTPANSWSFKNAYAGVLGLGDRIERFQAVSSGRTVSVRMLAAGEFRSLTLVDRVSYDVKLTPRSLADLPHISWLSNNNGILLLGDLLPETVKSPNGVSVQFDVPADWHVSSTLVATSGGFLVDDPEEAVFVVGRELHFNSVKNDQMELRLIRQGNWRFADKDLLKPGLELLTRYQQLTGFKLRNIPTIVIVPFPIPGSTANWKAETRGSNSILLLNPQASWKNWRAQLAIILTHELFHLWVPNSLQLKGDYDWFFEGFTSYIALQAALEMKLISFQEYLNTVGRVYDSYLSGTDDQSLLEASERRWTSSAPVVYDKGMLVAFIYDLRVRRASGGSSSLRDVYRSLFARFVDEPAEANDVIIQALTSSPATSDFAKSYVEARKRIYLEEILPEFGVEVDRADSRTHLRIPKELRDDQKKLLRTLGYHK